LSLIRLRALPAVRPYGSAASDLRSIDRRLQDAWSLPCACCCVAEMAGRPGRRVSAAYSCAACRGHAPPTHIQVCAGAAGFETQHQLTAGRATGERSRQLTLRRPRLLPGTSWPRGRLDTHMSSSFSGTANRSTLCRPATVCGRGRLPYHNNDHREKWVGS
jgi:hypothetical protein